MNVVAVIIVLAVLGVGGYSLSIYYIFTYYFVLPNQPIFLMESITLYYLKYYFVLLLGFNHNPTKS